MSLLEHGLTTTVTYPKKYFADMELSDVRTFIADMEQKGWDIRIGCGPAFSTSDRFHFYDMIETERAIRFQL